jgi:hypothetical protein
MTKPGAMAGYDCLIRVKMTRVAADPAGPGLIIVQIFIFRDNPLKYTDPDGRHIINDTNRPSAEHYQNAHPARPGSTLGNGNIILGPSQQLYLPLDTDTITLPNGLDKSLSTAHQYQSDGNPSTDATITSSYEELPSGNFEISITVVNTVTRPDGTISSVSRNNGVIAYAGPGEVGIQGAAKDVNPQDVNQIAEQVINTVNKTPDYKNNVSSDH